MEVFTNTPKVIESRKMTLEMLLSVHNKSCLTCKRSGTCELQALCQELGVEDSTSYEGAMPDSLYDDSTYHLVRDNSQVHPLPPLRGRLREPARGRHRPEQPRL